MIYIRKIQQDSKDKAENKHKELHNTAHELLLYAIEKEYKEKVNKLTMRSSQHGKPYFAEKQENGEEVLSEIKFNLSHSGEMAVCILGKTEAGIDIEKLRKYNPKVADKVLSDEEWDFLQKSEQKDKDFIKFWTLKEAYGKYTGKGLGMDFKQVIFRLQEDGSIQCSDEKVVLYQYEIEQEYVLSVCVERKGHWQEDEIIFVNRQEEEHGI